METQIAIPSPDFVKLSLNFMNNLKPPKRLSKLAEMVPKQACCLEAIANTDEDNRHLEFLASLETLVHCGVLELLIKEKKEIPEEKEDTGFMGWINLYKFDSQVIDDQMIDDEEPLTFQAPDWIIPAIKHIELCGWNLALKTKLILKDNQKIQIAALCVKDPRD